MVSEKMPDPLYTTEYGKAYVGNALELLAYIPDSSVDLVITSPPFALQLISVPSRHRSALP